jgi:hypothetical protein
MSRRGPVLLELCHSLGDKVRIRATMTAPAGRAGRITVALQDVRADRLAGAPTVCADLDFAGDRPTRQCGPVTMNPARGHRYRVVATATLDGDGRDRTGTARGHEFDW